MCKKSCRTEKRFSQYGQLCIKLHMATWRPFLIKIGTIFLNFLEISKKLILCVNLRYFGQLSGGLFWVWNVFSILSRKLLLLLLLLLLYNNVRPFLKITYYFFCQPKWVGRVTFPLITLLFVGRLKWSRAQNDARKHTNTFLNSAIMLALLEIGQRSE